MKNKILVLALFSINIYCKAQNEKLIKEVIKISSLMTFGDKLIFSGYDSNNGQELWISDGTTNGTRVLKDINNGSEESSPISFRKFNDIVIFETVNAPGRKLYRTDGTENGTFPIWDRGYSFDRLGGLYSEISVDGNYYWGIYNNYSDLYGDEGSLILKNLNNFDVKTILDKSILSEINKIYPNGILRLGNKWLFYADDINRKFNELSVYISDGTSKNTQKLISTRSGILKAETQFGHQIFYTVTNMTGPYADDVIKSVELWRTDGTNSGNVKIKTFENKTNITNSTVNLIKPFGKGICFWEFGTGKPQLWFSDGSDAGTRMIKNEDTFSAYDYTFLDLKSDNKLFFYNTNLGGQDLWETDGTTTGTKFLSKADGSLLGGQSQNFLENGNMIYYRNDSTSAIDGSIVSNILRTDKLTGITTLVGKVNYLSGECAILGNTFYYYGFNKEQPNKKGLMTMSLCQHKLKINTNSGTSFCTGSSIALSAETTGNTSSFTFKWRQGNSDVVGTSPNLTVSKAGNYTIEVTDKTGCIVSSSIDITQVTNLPVSITGTNSICSGQNSNLTATVSGGAAPFTYQWKNNTTNIGTNTNTLLTSTDGTYNVSITDSKGCTGTSSNYTVKQIPSPNVTITKSSATDLLAGGSVVLSVPSATNQTYQWLKDNIAISGATNNSYTATGAGIFSVTVTSNGCSATSEAITVSVVLANELPSESKNFKVSPNPFENSIKINFNEPLIKIAKLNLINSFGSIVKEWVTNQQDNVFDILGLPSGIYILKCERNDKIEIIKLVKN